MPASALWIELRGRRCEATMARLPHAAFAFRAAVASGRAISEAGVAALEIDEAFNVGEGLARFPLSIILLAVSKMSLLCVNRSIRVRGSKVEPSSRPSGDAGPRPSRRQQENRM